MKFFLKRLLIILGITFVLFITGAVVVASLFEDRVGHALTEAINRQLEAKLTVKGFDLTVFRSFPMLSADLKGVVLEDTKGGSLLEAKTMRFRMGLLSLLRSNLEINAVIIGDGALRILIDDKGKGNYEIFKPGNGSGKGPGPNIDLSSARLERVAVSFADARQNQHFEGTVEEASFSGAFSGQAFTLDSKARLKTNFIDLDGVRYLPGREVSYDASVAVNLRKGIYELERVLLAVEGQAFAIEGRVETWDAGIYYDLYLTADEGDLAGALALLPAVYTERLEGFTSRGRFAFDAIVKGLYNAQQKPEVRVEFSLDDGTISSNLLESPVKDVNLRAVFSNGKYRDNSSSVFSLDHFKGYFNRELLEMSGQVKNFDDPVITFRMDGVLPLSSFYNVFGKPNITDGFGEIEFKQINIDGRYEDLINPARIRAVSASGELEFDDAGLIIGGEELILDRGVLRITGNQLSIDKLRLEGAGSDITFEGTAFNLLPVLFSDSSNTSGAQLEFDARLAAKSLDIDRLLNILKSAGETVGSLSTEKVAAAHSGPASLMSYLNGTFDARIGAFNYKRVEGRNFSGTLTFHADKMKVLGEVNAFGGQVALDGDIDFRLTPVLTARLAGEAIDVNALFEQTENFGQDILTHDHLDGRLTTQMAVYAYWDDKGAFLTDQLRVLAGVGISEGTLQGFEMLEGFSDYVHIEDLKTIHFVDLQNFLEIRNRRLYLPVMFIRSNALNLTVSGEHSFDNEIAYYLKVNAGQVLADRFRRHDSALKPKPARKAGFFNLYYAMLGTLEDYTVSSAKDRVKDDFERSMFRKREIQSALEQEFGVVKLIGEPESWKDIPEFDHGPYNPEAEEYLDFEVGGR